MEDFRNYVSFEVPEYLTQRIRDAGDNPALLEVSPHERARLEKALEEIASTPEGLALLKQVAERDPHGKINIMTGGAAGLRSSSVLPNDIIIGDMDSRMRYADLDTGKTYHDISVQRLLIHELYHHAHDHKEKSLENEEEAINSTNDYMLKYYNEPRRALDHDKVDYKGTEGWDFNENFNPNPDALERVFEFGPASEPNPERLRGFLANLPAEKTEHLSPETQSLYELRENPALFAQQFREIEGYGGIVHIADDMPVLRQAAATPAAPPASLQAPASSTSQAYFNLPLSLKT